MSGRRMRMAAEILQHLRVVVPELPSQCTRVVLTLEVDELPRVEATFHPLIDVTGLNSEAVESLADARVVKRYRLVPDDQPPAFNVGAGVSRAEVAAAVDAAAAELERSLIRRLRQHDIPR